MATRRRVGLAVTAGSTRDMPAAGFVRQVLEQSAGGLPAELVTLRAAVVGGFSAGGLRHRARP